MLRPLLLLLLLLSLSSIALSSIPHSHAADGREIRLQSSGCLCMGIVNPEGRTYLASKSMEVTVPKTQIISAASEDNDCTCGSEAQTKVASGVVSSKLPLSSHISSSYRSLASLSAVEVSVLSQAASRRHYFASAPAPSIDSRHHHGLSHVPSPRNGPHYVNEPAPNPNAFQISPSPTPGPVLQASAAKGNNHSHHHHAKSRLSPAPVSGPLSASPLGHHPSDSLGTSPDCSDLVCKSPLTKASLLSPCGCVWPIQVELELNVPLYELFPLISTLAAELAEGVVLSPSQVEIVGANAAGQNQEISIVDVNLLPLDQNFDNLTSLLIFERLWNHEVILNTSVFGNYTVAYVHYPGLPPSPPDGNLGGIEHPLGVDVSKRGVHRGKLQITVIVAIILSSAIMFTICLGAAWIIASKYTHHTKDSCCQPQLQSLSRTNEHLQSLARTKRSGRRSSLSSDLYSSISMSVSSSVAPYGTTARSFTFAELARATNNFRPENVIGEGGFGRVYAGVLDDETKVAIKMLTRRDEQQGGKEFLAEVEMLSRLHHRNLVKLIGICTEEHSRCLVYELVPNGSVESHLHGTDKHKSLLSWEIRMKIALGAARGLAYLHEDSNPRVIHRDFKAGNILLEDDFNPKVSDFGLAKVAPDGGSDHISTRVMGTFGYVAPEYAMTGHLLVKSDVYSYGVVLLELLSGRKPVDMSQPAGQENLVTWARPLLTSKEGLRVLVDPALHKNFPFDSLVRVATIASMCVQPEVSHRPFMGEVVQALKLIYNDCIDVKNEIGSSVCSQGEGEAASFAGSDFHEVQWPSRQDIPDNEDDDISFISVDYDSGASLDGGRSLMPFPTSTTGRDSAGWRRYYNFSGPLQPKRGKSIVQGSLSDHARQHFNVQNNMIQHENLVDDFSRL